MDGRPGNVARVFLHANKILSYTKRRVRLACWRSEFDPYVLKTGSESSTVTHARQQV